LTFLDFPPFIPKSNPKSQSGGEFASQNLFRATGIIIFTSLTILIFPATILFPVKPQCFLESAKLFQN